MLKCNVNNQLILCVSEVRYLQEGDMCNVRIDRVNHHWENVWSKRHEK